MDSREISETVHHGSSIYTLDTNLLRELKPDVVLTQDLCDVCALSYRPVSEAVRKLDTDVTVLSLEPPHPPRGPGLLAHSRRGSRAEDVARQRIGDLNKRLEAVRAKVAGKPRPRVAAIEWLDPVWRRDIGCRSRSRTPAARRCWRNRASTRDRSSGGRWSMRSRTSSC
ncbi:hypothetical protein GCM10018954_087220 [Kutzneria kofuensis]